MLDFSILLDSQERFFFKQVLFWRLESILDSSQGNLYIFFYNDLPGEIEYICAPQH